MIDPWNWRYHAEQANLTEKSLTQLLQTAFDYKQLVLFCYDELPAVYGQFHKRDDHLSRIKKLLTYTRKHGVDLPALVKPHAPYAYEQYEQTEAGWNKTAERYREALRYQVETMMVLGKSGPVRLEGEGSIFTDVYLLDEPTAFKRHSINFDEYPKRLDRLNEDERYNGLEVVIHPDSPNLFVLGKPGAGKTTFLKYIALQCVKGELPKIPFLIRLHEWANDGLLDLLSNLTQQITNHGLEEAELLVTHWLQSGLAVVLFDGLDEIAQDNSLNQQAVEKLKQFARYYFTCQIVITCRIAANQYRFEQFQLVEVADFNDEQMRKFVSYWFANDEITRNAFLTQYFDQQDERFRELGNNPLLLSLLCLGFTGQFPKNRGLLYEDALQQLLEDWNESKGIDRAEDAVYRDLSTTNKKAMFAQLAYQMINRKQYYIPARELTQWLSNYLQPHVEQQVQGREILRAIVAQYGILIERARGIYSFSHLSFQEYFAARYIALHEVEGTLFKLMTNVTNYHWREVFLLTASLLDKVDKFFILFQETIDKFVLKTAECKIIRLLEWLNHKTKAASSNYLTDFRIGYLGIHLGLAHRFARNLPFIPAHRLSLIFVLNLDLVHDLTLARGFNLGITRNLDFPLDLALDLALDLEKKIALDLALDIALTHAWLEVVLFLNVPTATSISQQILMYTANFEQVIDMADRLPTPVLANRLRHLMNQTVFPLRIENEQLIFAKKLMEIMTEERDLFLDIEWNENQLEQLYSYLNATKLFQECLAIAVVDRAKIESQMLQVPQIEE